MTEYYLFATFVFILCLGMLIVMKFVFRIDKPDNRSQNTKERESRILKLYEQIEDMLDGFEEYAEETKNEIKANKDEVRGFAERIVSGENAPLINEEQIERIISKNLENKLDNKVSEAVRRIVARQVKEETDAAFDNILSRIDKLESRSINTTENKNDENEIKEFMPAQFMKKPENLEELGESIERAIKNNASNESKETKKKKRRKALELYKSGMDINDIAKEVGIASSEIKLIIEFSD